MQVRGHWKSIPFVCIKGLELLQGNSLELEAIALQNHMYPLLPKSHYGIMEVKQNKIKHLHLVYSQYNIKTPSPKFWD